MKEIAVWPGQGCKGKLAVEQSLKNPTPEIRQILKVTNQKSLVKYKYFCKMEPEWEIGGHQRLMNFYKPQFSTSESHSFSKNILRIYCGSSIWGNRRQTCSQDSEALTLSKIGIVMKKKVSSLRSSHTDTQGLQGVFSHFHSPLWVSQPPASSSSINSPHSMPPISRSSSLDIRACPWGHGQRCGNYVGEGGGR